MSNFSASVQYDDFLGSVASDQSDHLSMETYFKEKDLLKDGERLVGFRISSQGNSGTDIHNVGFVGYFYDSDSFDEAPKECRSVEITIPVTKLFALFKRFDLVAVRKGVNLNDAVVDGPDYD